MKFITLILMIYTFSASAEVFEYCVWFNLKSFPIEKTLKTLKCTVKQNADDQNRTSNWFCKDAPYEKTRDLSYQAEGFDYYPDVMTYVSGYNLNSGSPLGDFLASEFGLIGMTTPNYLTVLYFVNRPVSYYEGHLLTDMNSTEYALRIENMYHGSCGY